MKKEFEDIKKYLISDIVPMVKESVERAKKSKENCYGLYLCEYIDGSFDIDFQADIKLEAYVGDIVDYYHEIDSTVHKNPIGTIEDIYYCDKEFDIMYVIRNQKDHIPSGDINFPVD